MDRGRPAGAEDDRELGFDAVQPYFRTGLARWLTRAGKLEGAAVGDRVCLELADDAGTLTGRVLADSGHEIALEWEEIDGVLELKIFPTGPARAVALRCSAWGMEAAAASRLERRLAAAVDRLASVGSE